MKRNHERGLTLIEVVIGSIILAVILLLTFMILMRVQSTYAEASLAQTHEDRCRSFIDTYKKDLAFCDVVTYAADGQSIRYRIPPNTASTGSIDWGYPAAGGHQSGWEAELAFDPETVYTESSAVAIPASLAGIPVENANVDMNHDGDQNDVFVEGRILKRIYDNTGLLQDTSTASDSTILMVNGGSLNGDINGDGINDYLFSVLDTGNNVVAAALIGTSGAKLRVNICHGSYTDSRKDFVLRQLRDEWNFRNSQ